MKKIIFTFLLALMISSCKHSVSPPTTFYSDSTVKDSLTVRKAGIRNRMIREGIDLKSLPAQPALRTEAITSQAPVMLPLLNWNDTTQQWHKGLNANYGNRINITFLMDGYLANDSLKALNDAKVVLQGLKTRALYSWYFNRFAFYIAFAHSAQAGVGQHATACGTLTTVNNYFGSYLGYGGICRYMSCNTATVNNVIAGTMSYTDVPVVICNTSVYGGAADGNMAIITTNIETNELLIHELGHALFGLGDEYDYGVCGSSARWNALATNDTAYARTLWGDTWISWLPGDGKYSGADYCPQGLRDSIDCEMRDLGQPFCPQCKKRGIFSFNYFVSNIDGFYPALTATTTNQFAVKILQPIANTVKITWLVNGVIQPYRGTAFIPANGTYTSLTVITQDTSKWLFKTVANSYSETWKNITVSNNTPSACTPQHQIQTLSCPTGSQGKWIQTRNYPCPAGNWSAWKDSINTCAVIIVPTVLPHLDSIHTSLNSNSFKIYWRNNAANTRSTLFERNATSTGNFSTLVKAGANVIMATEGLSRTAQWQIYVTNYLSNGKQANSDTLKFQPGINKTWK